MRYLIFLLLVGCVSKQPKIGGVDEFTQQTYIQTRQYKELITAFESSFKNQEIKEKDQLLAKLNYATILHYDGQYLKSPAVLKECQTMVENYDLSAGEEVLGFINAKTKKFKLEDFEVLNISFLKTLNYLLANDLDSALAEMRRMDRISRMLAKDRPNLLEQTNYNSYLSGILLEARGDLASLENAYIDYKRLQKAYPRHPYIRYDLVRTATRLGRIEDLKQWEKTYEVSPAYKEYVKNPNPDMGEVVIIFSNGLAPRKTTHRDYKTIPVYLPRYPKNSHVKISIDEEDYGHSVMLADFQNLMIINLENQYATAIGVAEAQKLTEAILTVGALPVGLLALNLAKAFQADVDTRAWDMLPSNYQIARIPLKPGKHKIELSLEGTGEYFPSTVEIVKGRKTLLFLPVHE